MSQIRVYQCKEIVPCRCSNSPSLFSQNLIIVTISVKNVVREDATSTTTRIHHIEHLGLDIGF
jgi:hypothetical protein